MSKRILLTILAVGAMGLWLNTPARARHWSNHTVNVNTRDHGAWDDCQARYEVDFDDQDTFRAQEQQTVTRSSFSTLRIHNLKNSGMAVHGWDRPDVQITMCKAVGAASQKEADERLRQIQIRVNQGDVTIVGMPDEDEDIWVGLLVQVPRGIAMDVSAHNGPISLQDVEGNVNAETENGPISLKHCSGTLDVSARNGPVSLQRGSGKVRLELQNGPLNVDLEPQAWQGEGLEAHTQNGPLNLRVPENYSSGVEVESSWHSPFRCRMDACNGAVKDWDNEGRSRSIRLGRSGAPTLVRISTVNGPVSIGSTEF